jgi:chromosome segregation ATPase
VLAYIGELVHLGHRREEIKALLPSPGRSDEQPGSHASGPYAEVAQRLRHLEDALARARTRISVLDEQAVNYEHRLEAEQAAHGETRRTLLEAQHKLAEVQGKLVEAQRANKRLLEGQPRLACPGGPTGA